MIRFAHPFGAILRMLSALRATSSFRWDDESAALNLQLKIAHPGYMSRFFLAIHVFPGEHLGESRNPSPARNMDSGLRRNDFEAFFSGPPS